MDKSAIISPCGRYRYLLERRWRPGNLSVLFVMLNPSTADSDKDDPTLRKCIKYAQSFGYDHLSVTNLFAWRATDPRALPSDAAMAIGPDNDIHLREVLTGTSTITVTPAPSLVICAWGTKGTKWGRDKEVLALIRQYHQPSALWVTDQGHPAHPLYLPNDVNPRPYTGR